MRASVIQCSDMKWRESMDEWSVLSSVPVCFAHVPYTVLEYYTFSLSEIISSFTGSLDWNNVGDTLPPPLSGQWSSAKLLPDFSSHRGNQVWPDTNKSWLWWSTETNVQMKLIRKVLCHEVKRSVCLSSSRPWVFNLFSKRVTQSISWNGRVRPAVNTYNYRRRSFQFCYKPPKARVPVPCELHMVQAWLESSKNRITYQVQFGTLKGLSGREMEMVELLYFNPHHIPAVITLAHRSVYGYQETISSLVVPQNSLTSLSWLLLPLPGNMMGDESRSWDQASMPMPVIHYIGVVFPFLGLS